MQRLNSLWKELIREALKAQKNAYAPYSKFYVGCSLRDAGGKVFSGCNVENASYAGVTCAERTAIVKMVSEGGREIKNLVVVTSSREPLFPCGICLQMISEFGTDCTVLAVDRSGKNFREAAFKELYPHYFSKSQLKGRPR